MRSASDRRRGVFTRLGGIFVLAGAVGLVWVGTAFGGRCPDVPASPYTSGFASLPQIREVPRSGALPFGPAGLILHGPLTVVTPKETVSFLLTAKSIHSYRLGWTATLAAARIDKQGEPFHNAVTRRYRLQPAQLNLNPAVFEARLVDTGVYEVSVTFDRGTRRLGAFSSYVRVSPRREKARLLVDPRPLKPGDYVTTRMFNPGSIGFSYGSGIGLLKRTESGWEDVSPRSFISAGAIEVPAGEGSFCQRFQLPNDLQPGEYQVKREVNFQGRHSAWVTAEFSVR